MLFGIGSFLFLSSCRKMEYSRENLVEALRAFSADKGDHANKKFEDILARIGKLEGTIEGKLSELDDQTENLNRYAGDLQGFFNNGFKDFVTAANDMVRYKQAFKGLEDLLKKTGDIQQFNTAVRDMSQGINRIIGSQDQTMRALNNLSALLDRLNDEGSFERLAVNLENLLNRLGNLLDGNGVLVVDRVRDLNNAIDQLNRSADAFVKKQGDIETTQASLHAAVAAINQQLAAINQQLAAIGAALDGVPAALEDVKNLGTQAYLLSGVSDHVRGIVQKLEAIIIDPLKGKK